MSFNSTYIVQGELETAGTVEKDYGYYTGGGGGGGMIWQLLDRTRSKDGSIWNYVVCGLTKVEK